MAKLAAIILFFVLLLAVPRGVGARNFPMLHYTTENGLPSNTIYSVYRDSKGFLWMGTDKGAVRYDGLAFERFTTDDGLPDNEIFFFQEDYEGRLWLSTYNGELCYYKDGVFHTGVNTPFLKKSVKYAFISWMTLEKDSSITMSFSDRLAFLNIKGDKCRSYYLKGERFPQTTGILAINKISENRYSLLCGDKTFDIDTASNYIPNTERAIDGVYRITLSQTQRYLDSRKGIYSLGQAQLLKFGNALATSFIYTVYRDSNNWFIGTSNGLFINNDLQILKGNRVNNVTQDIEGNIWISTLDNGVFCLGKDFSNSEEYDSVYSGGIRYARAVGKYLFFTTGNSNFYRFENNKTSLLFDYYQHFGKYFKGENAWENYLSTNTRGHGVDDTYKYYNIEDYSFIIDKINTDRPVPRFLGKGEPLYIMHVKELFFGKKQIFIRNPDFISVIGKGEIESGGLAYIKKIGSNPRGRRVFGMALAPDNTLWYSSSESVNKITDTASIPQPQFGNITFKWMQMAGNYGVGITHKNQLLVCRNYESKDMHVDTLPGGNFVWDKLYLLNDTTFLVSTDNLYRLLCLHNGEVSPAFTLQIIENKFLPLQAEYICNNDSFCYFFKKCTVTRVPFSSLAEQYMAPMVFFKSLKTRNGSTAAQEGVVIGYDESKNINISFSPFCFGSRYVICEYSISKDSTAYWRQVANNEINLFSPSFGSYTLKVRARTLSGSFSKPFVFHFIVRRPFWATSWFMGAAVLLFAGLVVLCIRIITLRNTRKKARAHQNEIKFLKSEYKALNALMNPHFIFNTLNNVQWLVNNDDKLTANHYLRIFSDLVRQNMSNVSKELIPLTNEIELVSNYLKLEKLRFKDALNYEINIDEELDLGSVKIPPLLIQPLVENAIKHGLLPGTTSGNLLQMDIYRKEDKLYIDVKDNGIGFEESLKRARGLHKSTGIENIKKRIDNLSMMHDIDISFAITELQNAAGLPAGTLARVCIDLGE